MIGLQGAYGTSSVARAVLLLGLFAPSLVQADRTPEPLWQRVNVQLDVGTELSECPRNEEVVTWVNDLVGWEFAADEAPVMLTIRVGQAANKVLSVELVATEPTDAAVPTTTELRRFERLLTCAELLRATALTISLFAKAPPEGVAPAVSSPNTTQPAGPALDQLEQGQPPPNSPATDPQRDEAADPTVLPPPPTLAPPVEPTRAAPPRSEGPLPSAAQATTPKGSSAAVVSSVPVPGETSEGPTVTSIVGVTAHVVLGVNPGVGLGANAYAGLQWRGWEWLLRGGYSVSTGERPTPGQPGTIHASTAELALALCPTLVGLLPFASDATLRLCGFGGGIWIYARGEGFLRDRRESLRTLALGVSSELLLKLNEDLALGIKLEVLAPLAPAQFQVTGEPPESWSMWSAAPRVGIGLEWR